MDQPLFRRADGALGDPTGLATGLDSGDTAFIIICGALVLMMTLPGLVLFYSNLSLSPILPYYSLLARRGVRWPPPSLCLHACAAAPARPPRSTAPG